jgi:hypothetical protein
MQPEGIAKCANCGATMPSPVNAGKLTDQEVAALAQLALSHTLLPVLGFAAIACIALLICANLGR